MTLSKHINVLGGIIRQAQMNDSITVWKSLFYQTSALTHSDYFLLMEYSTKSQPLVDHHKLQVKHMKMIGFVESRLTSFAQTLESELKIFDQVLLDPSCPYNTNLKSVIIVTLPVCKSNIDLQRDAISRAFSLFDWRLQTSGDITNWKSAHESRYEIVTFCDLPLQVIQNY